VSDEKDKDNNAPKQRISVGVAEQSVAPQKRPAVDEDRGDLDALAAKLAAKRAKEGVSVPITGWGHVGIRVHDMDRSLAFYELLGFRKVVGPIGPEPVAILVHPAGIEINLVLNAPDADTPNPLMDVPHKLPGYTHMALTVADLDAAEKVLVDAGHAITGRMETPVGMKAIFVRDPDRNVVELDFWPGGMPSPEELMHKAKALGG
jgi:lactoylglutathione lyase